MHVNRGASARVDDTATAVTVTIREHGTDLSRLAAELQLPFAGHRMDIPFGDLHEDLGADAQSNPLCILSV